MKMIKSNSLFNNSKYLILFAFVALFSNISYGQDFYHGVGAQYDYGIFNLEYADDDQVFSNKSTPAVPGIFYKATLAFSDKFAVSAYPFLGFSGSFNSQSGGSGSLGIQLPVVAEMYFGDIDDACFFAGAGFSYASLGSSDFGSGKAFGPQLSIGGQFEFRDRLIGLRAAYTHGLNKSEEIANIEFTKDTHALISAGVYYVLGN